jgi:prepilin-type N-terminal cleavage/methylation domain-containing protein
MLPIFSLASAKNSNTADPLMKTKGLLTKWQNAFSLLELMIVILIVSLSYLLVFSYMQKVEQKPKALTPLTLKSTLVQSGYLKGGGELFCLDKCQKCYLFQNNKTTEYEEKLDLGDLKIYMLGQGDNPVQVEFGRYRDHPVCLRFKLHSNGSSSEMIIEQNGKFFYLPASFGDAAAVKSIEEAAELWLKQAKIINDGEYY